MKKLPTTPLPGRPVRNSQAGRPIMAALDLLSRKWLLRILWELRDRALSFRELQLACGGISPTILNSRLKDMRKARLVEEGSTTGYVLTPLGDELLKSLDSLNRWTTRWSKEVESEAEKLLLWKK